MFIAINGCNNGGNTAVAPGPTTPTGYSVTLTADLVSLEAGNSTVVMATVTDGSGAPLGGAPVAFTIPINNSTATITTIGGITGANGKAVAVYTAGTFGTTSVQDTIRASVGSVAGAVVITRLAGTVPVPGVYRMTLTADVTTLAAGQNSILTATVTDGTGNPVSGETVTFDFIVDPPPSGGSVSVVDTGITDASGKALAVYTAGATTPAISVQDAIRAAVTGSTGAVIITRTASTVVPGVYHMALTADVTTLAAGQNTIITATVTDSSGNPASGRTVAFTPITIPSGGSVSVVGTGITDASGRAVAIYTAGALLSTTSVQDTIQAVDTGFTSATGAVIMTRTASTATPPAGYRMTLTADVTTLAAEKNAIVTATVTDSSGNPASGQAVVFAFNPTPALSGATLTPLIIDGVTDASGSAVAIYKAGSLLPTTSVQDTIQATVSGYTSGAIVMTRTASGLTPPEGFRLTITATPVSLAANANSVIIAKVINNATGGDAAGVTVAFDFLDSPTASGGTVAAVGTGITDAQGYAIATYTAGNATPSVSIQDVVTATVTGSSGAVIITRLPTLGTGNRIISFTEDPETGSGSPPGSATGPVIMKVKVTTDNLTSPVVGVTVTFSILASGTGTLSSPTATTDTNGEAYVIFTRPDTGSGETVVRAQIPGTINGGDAARIVYWAEPAGP